MSRKLLLVVTVCCALMVTVVAVLAQESKPETSQPLGTGFTFQGRLQRGGSSFSDTCNMAFRLYDSPSAGLQIGAPVTTSVPVTNGLFTVELNTANEFGASAFTGSARWLGESVRCPGDPAFTALLPREAVSAAPYALYSSSTGALQGRPVNSSAPSVGQTLGWDGSAWSPTKLATPLAFGSEGGYGNLLSGTPNFTITYAAVYTSTMPPTTGFVYNKVYLVKIAGESYDYRYFATTVTPGIGCYYAPWTFSLDGMLVIQFHNDLGGQYDICDFSFVVFKP